jgi:DNA repair ATPase RecN
MINNISIQNFAILEEMDLNFHNGLTVITGETGAGKSILLHAIRASLGGKVKGTAVRSGTDKAIVEIEVHLMVILIRADELSTSQDAVELFLTKNLLKRKTIWIV